MVETIWAVQQDNYLFVILVLHKNLNTPSKIKTKTFFSEFTCKPDSEQINALKDVFQYSIPNLLNTMKTKFEKVT